MTDAVSLDRPQGFFRTLKDYVANSFKVLRHPKNLILTLVLGILWIVFSLLSSLGLSSKFLTGALFLTFADGGMFGGIWGAAGGILGKVVTAVFYNTLFGMLFRRNGTRLGVWGGIKAMASSLTTKGAGGVSPLFMGSGLALLLYSFMNFNQSFENSIIGLFSAVLILSGMFKQSGLMMSLVFSLLSLFTKGHSPSLATVNRVLSGMVLGFGAGTALSAGKLRITLVAGLFFLLLSIVLAIVAGKKKGGTK